MNEYLNNLFSLKGKVCIVSGASRGIGKSIADSFYDAGGIVYGIGRTKSKDMNVDWNYLSCDITRLNKISSIFEDIAKKESSINVLVNAAGITNPDIVDDYLKFKETLEVNLLSAYSLSISASHHMKRLKSGSIINITSIGSKVGFPENPSYVASKGGLRMLTKALANDLGKYNIRVNNLAPGYIKTDMTKVSFNDANLNSERKGRMLINRWGTPKDLNGAAIFLASDASSYVSGSDIWVDGGWIAKGL